MPDGDAPPPVKRKTRRGSRGGRNHRKKPAATGDAVATGDGTPNGVASLDGDSPASEHDDVPAFVAAVESEAVADSAVLDGRSAEPDVQEVAAPAAALEQGDEGYVPMSEWLADFDRR